ncbi:MAG: hypothetical protein KatS3mg087_1353 [Patescibacteria group bacterium]|nr:MAG: hypothetical protein KatS3mg087_1353 [Patescibacteria group bacterium]
MARDRKESNDLPTPERKKLTPSQKEMLGQVVREQHNWNKRRTILSKFIKIR